MSDSQQDLLRKAWTEGRTGTLSALSEAKAWALREVWRSEGKGEAYMVLCRDGLHARQNNLNRVREAEEKRENAAERSHQT